MDPDFKGLKFRHEISITKKKLVHQKETLRVGEGNRNAWNEKHSRKFHQYTKVKKLEKIQ